MEGAWESTCTRAGYQTWLRDLGAVELVHFPYENLNSKMKKVAGSHPTWEQCNLTFDQSDFSWKSLKGSEMFPKAKDLLRFSGQNVDVDLQHIHAAYKAGCDAFVTTEFFHVHDDKEKIIEFCSR